MIYLAHPNAQKERGAALTADLRARGYDVINPFERPMQTRLNAVIASGEAFTEEHCRAIVEGDLAQVRKAGMVVAIINGVNQVGTLMEVFYASYILHKPVVVLYEMDYTGNGKYHPWIQYLTDIQHTWDDVIAALEVLK